MDLKNKNEEIAQQENISVWSTPNKTISTVNRLFDKYGPTVYSRCQLLFGQDLLSKEITSFVLLKSYLHLQECKNNNLETNFVKQLTCKLCLDIALRAKPRTNISIYSEELPDQKYIEELFGEKILRLTTKDLKAVLNELPLGDKVFLLLVYQDDLSLLEIANLLELPKEDAFQKFNNAQARAIAIYQSNMT